MQLKPYGCLLAQECNIHVTLQQQPGSIFRLLGT